MKNLDKWHSIEITYQSDSDDVEAVSDLIKQALSKSKFWGDDDVCVRVVTGTKSFKESFFHVK